jgi:hypothetical protein
VHVVAAPVFVPRHAAVFYRVRCLRGKQPKQLWGFLRNDQAAWWRTGLDTLYALGLRDASFTVVEYYLYYLRDVGLQGHPHDIERVFVFLPRSIDIARAAAHEQPGKRAAEPHRLTDLGDSLRVIVGTGHSSTTPNNVLVLVGRGAWHFRWPNILVELGGHSSAPDLDRDSRFHPGVDINWNLSADVWGTRDIQAVSGRGYMGRYETDMTFPRPPNSSVLLVPPVSEIGAQVDSAMKGAQQQWMPVPAARADSVAGRADSAVARVDSASYSLLAVRHLAQLYRYVWYIERAATAADTAALLDSLHSVVNDSIAPALRGGWGFEGFPSRSREAVLAAARQMQRWDGKVETDGRERSQPLVWNHPDYRGSPIRVLKRRLYRPTFSGIQNAGDVLSLLTFNTSVAFGRGGQQAQVGLIVPALRGPIVIPGVLEVQVGAYGRRLHDGRLFGGPTHVSISALYERHYRRVFSWYVRPLDFVRSRGDLEKDPRSTDLALGFGGSIMPFFPFSDAVPFLSGRLRLRGGIRLDGKDWEPRLARFELQTTIYVR